MTNDMPNSSTSPPQSAPRRLACPRCGTVFDCKLSGNCWCDGEAARLPLPVEGEDCLCPSCLRVAAAGAPNGSPRQSD